MTQPLVVVAAVIERHGLILIGQRKRNARNHPLKWEFPGGKVEPGESPEAALARELREELAIDATIGAQLDAYDFLYPATDRTTRLLFFHVTNFDPEPTNLDFEQILWTHRTSLADYDFLEGDTSFVQRFASGEV